MPDPSIQWSRPSDAQLRLLKVLASKWTERAETWVDGVLVSPMDDGGMGSLRLMTPGLPLDGRRFGRKAAEHRFADDGVAVLASLFLDQNDVPFELDVWKTDFSPVMEK